MFFKRKEPLKENCVADLDRIISKTVTFKLHGKIHSIKPITSIQFFEFTNETWKLDDMAHDKSSKGEDIKKQYLKVIQTVCDSITLKDIGEMSEAQMSGMFRVITDAITGHSFKENTKDEKKNLIKLRS